MIPMIVPPTVLTLKAKIRVVKAMVFSIKTGATIHALISAPRIPVPMISPKPAA